MSPALPHATMTYVVDPSATASGIFGKNDHDGRFPDHDLHRRCRERQDAHQLLQADRPWAGGVALNHGGSNTLNRAVIWVAPEIDFGLAVAANQGGRLPAVAIDRAVNALIARYVTKAEKKDLSDKL